MLVVGALRSGGSGKTDWVSWIAATYGDLAILVHPTGDEDHLLQSLHPGRVFSHQDFLQAWTLARTAGFTRAVADGGFQDPALDSCPGILLGESKVDLEDLHPFGPFRQVEPARSVDLHLKEGEGWNWTFPVQHSPASDPYLLACSVSQPARILHDLSLQGIHPVGTLFLRDHKPFPIARIRRLESLFPHATWLLTAKDQARGEVPKLQLPSQILRRTLEVTPPLAARIDHLLSQLPPPPP